MQPDYRGARGSNAGDDFHELWTLRQALTLLDPNSDMRAITVEGLRAENESGTSADTWDGVDCAFYFGGYDVDTAERITIDQVKYSSANPEKAWTFARLTQPTNRNRDNSVIGRLAKAFSGLNDKRPDLAVSGKLKIRLVSNQPVHPAVINGLENIKSLTDKSRTKLQRASKLDEREFEIFINSLDLSECGSGSRFALDENVLSTISEWLDDEAWSAVNHLKSCVHKLNLPEAKGEFITRHTILSWLGYSDPSALFPCPSVIKKIEEFVPRDVSRQIAEHLQNGEQHICLHGEGGCGKTTALQGVENLLPVDSAIIIYDCYGGGRYLDSDAFRHRRKDAFRQISNDLATQLRIPFLLGQKVDDYPRAFKKRLDKAAEVVASQNPDALLAVIIDAADNSITAADIQSPPERSFVRDFVSISQLPGNVRFVVTARTGQLPSLELPRQFTQIPMAGFTIEETAAYVRPYWSDAPNDWIVDFHDLSNGNPRVQNYVLEIAGTEPAKALEHLRPGGKNLDQIFNELFTSAVKKLGINQEISRFCSGLITLPRPIPISDLSSVTDLSSAKIRDICNDLAPGIRLNGELISFADEDFERFIRAEAEDELSSIQNIIADHFSNRCKSDAYAATHLVSALFRASRRSEIIDLINSGDELTAIRDPVLRRNVYLQRLSVAMKVCRETGNNVDAVLTLLRGAEALKTDDIIRNILKDFPDIAANFARDTASGIILRDSDEIESHGPLLFQSMAVDARNGDSIAVREGHRQVRAWLNRRDAYLKEQKRKDPDFSQRGWSITSHDIAAETEAILRIGGPQSAVDIILRWSPKNLALKVASILSSRLITSGDAHLVEECLRQAVIPAPWDLFLLIPLALAGKEVDLSRINFNLENMLRRGLIRPETLKDTWQDENTAAEYLDTILTACETVIVRGGDRSATLPILERMANPKLRQRDRLFTSETARIDISLRAFALLERLSGRAITLESYLTDPPEPDAGLSPKETQQRKIRENEKQEELKSFIGPLLDLYDTRAQILLGLIKSDEVDDGLKAAVDHFDTQNYRYNNQYRSLKMRTRTALSLTRLMVLPGISRIVLMDCALAILDSRSINIRAEDTPVLASLALDRSLHEKIVSVILTQAATLRSLKISADEKISTLISFSRLLIPISHPEANSLANGAIEVAGEVNAEAIHEIMVFKQLTEYATGSLTREERKRIACSLAVVVGDVAVRIADANRFPWEDVAAALTTLNVSVALAATARWEDSSLTDRSTVFPAVLETALSHQDITLEQITALSPLLDQFSVKSISQIVDAMGDREANPNQKMLAEHLSREELLRFGNGLRADVTEKLSLLDKGNPGFWMSQLEHTTTFLQAMNTNQESTTSDEVKKSVQYGGKIDSEAPFSDINWSEYPFTSRQEIYEVIDHIRASPFESTTYISVTDILNHIGNAVEFRDRVLHLEALTSCEPPKVPGSALAEAIVNRLTDWHDVPSVASWRRNRLLEVVVDYLPDFTTGLSYGQSSLPAMLELSGLPSERICSALFDAVERHVDVLTAPTIYALVGLIVKYCTADDTARILSRYVDRLIDRIPIVERDVWDADDIPSDTAEGIARFLYSLLGDIDTRIRWRAAHAIRNLALFGEVNVIDRLMAHFDNTSESSYRMADAPFYWLSARLWLMIAIDKIANETPSALNQHGHRLFQIATDEKFPHLLIRAFAQSAVSQLVDRGGFKLNAADSKTLKKVNASPLRRKKARPYSSVGFKKYNTRDDENRRFYFDSLDTLPYWYSYILNVFADVDGEEFLDVAEKWIVEGWGVENDPWKWEDEPRKQRLSDRQFASMDHRHGSIPTLERYHTHLEWHAMWCATGELMQSHALVRLSEDAYFTLEHQIRQSSLTSPPLWLADVLGPKPLELPLWSAPDKDIDTWLENIDSSEFLSEIGLASKEGGIVVASSHETESSRHRASIYLKTALISPGTASALSRALQSISDSWDYRIPREGDEQEINKSPFMLVGWLTDNEHETGLDQKDPLSYDVSPIVCSPSSDTLAVLGLIFVVDSLVKWVKSESGDAVFTYSAWGDNPGQENGNRPRYDDSISSKGWRLTITKEALVSFLNAMELDLIVEIEITRRNGGYGYYRRHDQEEDKESRFDRIIILRRDGTLEAAEGHIGTWTVPRS